MDPLSQPSVSQSAPDSGTGIVGTSREPPGRSSGRVLTAPALFAVVAAVLIAAGVAALFHPQSIYRYKAEALLLVEADTTSERRAALARLEALRREIFLPHVAEAARGKTGARGDLLQRLKLEDGPQDGLRIIVRDESEAGAVALANAFAAQALNFPAVETADRVPLGGFEAGTEQWGATPSIFSLPSDGLRVVTESPREGSSSLRVVCSGDPGCGISLVVTRSFRTGITYKASAWLRSAGRPVPIGLILGANSEDFATGGGRLRSTWTQYSVEWTPTRSVTGAELSIHVNAPRAATFDVDNVVLGEQRAARESRSQLGARARGEEALTVLPAVRSGTIGGATLTWALLGGAVGLLIAVVAIGFGLLAGRRQQRADQ